MGLNLDTKGTLSRGSDILENLTSLILNYVHLFQGWVKKTQTNHFSTPKAGSQPAALPLPQQPLLTVYVSWVVVRVPSQIGRATQWPVGSKTVMGILGSRQAGRQV